MTTTSNSIPNASAIKMLNDDISISMELKLYPNPAKDIVFIETSSGVDNIEIYSVTGSLVYVNRTGFLPNELGKIQLGELSSGVYLVRAIKDNQSVVKRLIVHK